MLAAYLVNGIPIRYIQRDRCHITLYLSSRLFTGLRVARAKQDLKALSRQPLGDGKPNATVGPSNQSSAFQFVHHSLFYTQRDTVLKFWGAVIIIYMHCFKQICTVGCLLLGGTMLGASISDELNAHEDDRTHQHFYPAGMGEKRAYFHPNGTLNYTEDDDQEIDELIQRTYYRADGEILYWENYDPDTGGLTGRSYAGLDGMPHRSDYFNPATGRITAQCYYRDNGTVARWDFFDLKTGKLQTRQFFRADGEEIAYTENYALNTGKVIFRTDYATNGQITKRYHYRAKDGTLDWIADHDPVTGQLRGRTYYAADGKTRLDAKKAR